MRVVRCLYCIITYLMSSGAKGCFANPILSTIKNHTVLMVFGTEHCRFPISLLNCWVRPSFKPPSVNVLIWFIFDTLASPLTTNWKLRTYLKKSKSQKPLLLYRSKEILRLYIGLRISLRIQKIGHISRLPLQFPTRPSIITLTCPGFSRISLECWLLEQQPVSRCGERPADSGLGARSV